MALRIRLQRHGAIHAPMYRMVVAEKTVKRNGKFVENIGFYNPQARGKDIELDVKLDRVDYWTGVGAQASDTAAALIKKARKAVAAQA